MEMDHEIRSSQFPHNMAAWCNEKAEHSLASLARTLEQVREVREMSQTMKDSLLQELWFAVSDTSKLLAFSCGAEWDPSDADTVFEQGYLGLERVMVRYGMLQETSQDRQRKRLEQFLSRLETLLEGPRAPNRTMIHEALAGTPLQHPLLDEFGSLIESVSMGEMQWDAFVPLARDLVRRLGASLRER